MIWRFAPSTTGEAHPGTLLSALLVWLDARSHGGRVVLRLEDLDPARCQAAWATQLIEACEWLGLTWDEVVVQSGRRAAHADALDALDAAGRLYPCACSRGDRRGGHRAPDGSWAYDNRCRGRALPAGGWRAAAEPIRAQLDDDRIELVDDGGLDLSQAPARELGDPIVVRRDGVVAYQLAVVVDDSAAAISQVVRGRDIAPSTATQIMLQRLLGLATPRYRHHFLLLESTPRRAWSPAPPAEPVGPPPRLASLRSSSQAKLAKLHGSIPFSRVRARHGAAELCGILACAAGLQPSPAPCQPCELVSKFSWQLVPGDDRVARWDDQGGLAIAARNSGDHSGVIMRT